MPTVPPRPAELSIFRYVPKNDIARRLSGAICDAIRLIELEEGKYYTIQTNSRLEKIPYKEILFLSRDGKNTSITTADGAAKVRKSLQQVYEELAAEEFIFIDRGCILGSIFCALAAIVVASCLYPLRLGRTDAYAFYVQPERRRRTVKVHHRYSVWRYLFRYLMSHKNYLVNTAAMWGVACVLPVLFGQMEARFILPVGFAILSLNTPLCILLSCDPALEQAVRFLPEQQKAFCIPYCLFIFGCNLAADIIFLCSWQLQIGGIIPLHILTAASFALLSAAGSVLLEWYCPIRGWKIESDLWHHPRKYIVPAIVMLLAGLVSLF